MLVPEAINCRNQNLKRQFLSKFQVGKASVTFAAFNCALRFAAGSKTSGHPWGIHGASMASIDLQPRCGSSGHRTCKVEATKNCRSIYSRSACSGVQVLEYIMNILESFGIYMWPIVALYLSIGFHRV